MILLGEIMKKYKFLFNSFRNTSLPNLIKIVKKVKKICNKKFVLFDIINCSIKYQASFYDYLEFEFYLLNDNQRKTYLTSGKNNEIIKTFNDKSYRYIFNNKDKFNNKFKKYLKRDYLNSNFTKEDLNKFIKNKDKIIAKPIDGTDNNGLKIIDCNEKNIFEKYHSYLLEEIIIQNKKLDELYDKSVNSLRVFTFYDGKSVHILQSILKIGNNSITDNFSSGGMYAFLNDLGIVITPAIDNEDNIYGIHPLSKKQILGFQIPHFDKVIKLVTDAAKEVPQIKYVGWDIAILEDDVCIIEGNSYPGVFQIKPRFSKDKVGILPKYEKIMKIKL